MCTGSQLSDRKKEGIPATRGSGSRTGRAVVQEDRHVPVRDPGPPLVRGREEEPGTPEGVAIPDLLRQDDEGQQVVPGGGEGDRGPGAGALSSTYCRKLWTLSSSCVVSIPIFFPVAIVLLVPASYRS